MHVMSQDRREFNPYASSDDVGEPLADSVLETFLEGLHLYRPKTVYFSTPITTGLWFYEELLARGAQGAVQDLPEQLTSEVRRESMRRHVSAASESVAQLKLRLDEHNFINPATLQARWSQQRFLDFWVRVIEKYAGQIVLAQDWAYSTGSSYECLRALKVGIPLFEFEGNPVTAVDAREAVYQAVSGLEHRGLVPTSLTVVLAEFDKLTGTPRREP